MIINVTNCIVFVLAHTKCSYVFPYVCFLLYICLSVCTYVCLAKSRNGYFVWPPSALTKRLRTVFIHFNDQFGFYQCTKRKSHGHKVRKWNINFIFKIMWTDILSGTRWKANRRSFFINSEFIFRSIWGDFLS